jgi:hypothetical protein
MVLLFSVAGWIHAADAENQPLAKNAKEIAGTAEFLRSVPKRFARLQAVDPSRHRVTLLIEGENLAKEWDLIPDAELKVAGWWGRLDQFTIEDRVWVWFQTSRTKQPTALSMMADEISEQDMHGPGVVVEARTDETLTLKPVAGPSRTVRTTKAMCYRGQDAVAAKSLRVGDRVYVQSTGTLGGDARLIVDATALEVRRAAQQAALRKRWLEHGLPGTVSFVHRFSGEMDFVLDHEAMRWARSLQPGDKVTLHATPPIPAVVKRAQPWRERTQVRLVVAAADLADLAQGQRTYLRRPAPPPDVDTAQLPPDLDQPRTREERIEWFLASVYCTCPIKGDNCTGHVYTLSSCNPNGCGMPNQMRKVIAAKIDRGLTDRQIFEELLKERGPRLIQPHLVP